MASRPRQSTSGAPKPTTAGIRCEASSSRVKDKKESPPVPDSTTEPAPRPAQKFQEGDDVFYQTDTGQQMLGTVSEVKGQSCLIQFGDGTEQLASFKRLKKLFPDPDEVEEPKRKKPDPTTAKQPRPQQICGSCGVSRRISAKKAKLLQETSIPFECRRCVKQSHTPNSPTSILRPFLASTSSSLQGKLPPDVSITPMGSLVSPSSIFSLPSTTSPHSLKTKTPSLSSSITIPRQIHVSVVPGRQASNCFNCEETILPCDRVHCTMCQRPCHLMCLALTPPPLSGDKFWDVLCSTCGNQNSNEKVKVFSVRRNINYWADVACLIISCLSAITKKQMFDLDSEMLPFLEKNIEMLHLPRMYKSSHQEARHKFILNALISSVVRFQNGRELKQKSTLWGLRNDLDRKQHVRNVATEMGLKQKSIPETSFAFKPTTSQGPHSSNSTRVNTTKSTKNFIPTENLKMKIVKESDTDSTSSSDSSGISIKTSVCGSPRSSTSSAASVEKLQTDALSIDGDDASSTTSSSSSSTVTSLSSANEIVKIQKNANAQRNKRKELTAFQTAKCKNNSPSHVGSPSKKRLKLESRTSPLEKGLRSPVKGIIQKVVIKSPPRKTAQEEMSFSEPDEEDEDGMTLEAIKNQSHLLLRTKKTISVVPPGEIKEEIEVNDKDKLKSSKGKSRQEVKDKMATGDQPPKLKGRARGRPPGTSMPKATSQKAQNIVKSLRISLNSGKSSNVPIVSRRVGTFNSISEKRPVPTPIVQDLTALDVISEAIYEAALHGGYRMECLPRPPETEAEKRIEALKVFSHFRTEKENEIASALFGRKTETETRSQTRQKSEIYIGSYKRDLNDLDSYEVIGKRMDPDGITRYQVIWKHRREDGYDSHYSDEFSSEEDTLVEDKGVEKEAVRPFADLKLFDSGEETKEKPKTDELGLINEEVVIGLPHQEDSRSSDAFSTMTIDLTDSP